MKGGAAHWWWLGARVEQVCRGPNPGWNQGLPELEELWDCVGGNALIAKVKINKTFGSIEGGGVQASVCWTLLRFVSDSFSGSGDKPHGS